MTLSLPEIQLVVEALEKESKALKAELFKLAWYMRGGMTLEEAYILDVQDREIVKELINENLEITKETKLPFF